MSSSDVAAGRHVGDFAGAPRQTCLAMRCALAMAIAIKMFKKTCQVRKKKKNSPKKAAGQIAQIPLFLTFSLFF